MATKGKDDLVIEKSMSIGNLRESHAKMRIELQNIEEMPFCVFCGKHRPKSCFKKSSNDVYKFGVVPICKDCLNKIIYRVDKDGYSHDPSRESLIEALMYLNKPFIETVYDDSKAQEEDFLEEGKKSLRFPDIYLTTISKKQYSSLTFLDSDFFKKDKVLYADEKIAAESENKSVYGQIIDNRDDVVRLIGYDPFINDPLKDQPLLYSVLLGMLDNSEDANDDMMKTQSAVAIARMFLQNEKLDEALSSLQSDYSNIVENATTIKNIQESKYKLNSQITKYAQESCLSLKNAKNQTKGENTWTGKIRKLKDLNLRDAEVNGFDIATCRAMKQVMDLSNKSILQALKFDESEYSEMLAEAREARIKAENIAETYKEIARILLRENLDLKDFLEKKNLLQDKNLVDASNLYNKYGVLSDYESEEE